MTTRENETVIEAMCADQVTVQPPDQNGMELLPSVGYLDPEDARRVLRAALKAAMEDARLLDNLVNIMGPSRAREIIAARLFRASGMGDYDEYGC